MKCIRASDAVDQHILRGLVLQKCNISPVVKPILFSKVAVVGDLWF